MRRFCGELVTTLTVLLLGGCSFSSKPPPAAPQPPPVAIQQAPAPQIVMPAPIREALPPPPVAFAVEVSATANPDATGRASPVVVRLYELKSPVAFESADFFSLFDRESQTLGADLVARDEYQLKPGEQVLLARALRPGARYFAVAVAYRDLERARWRAVQTLPGSAPNGIGVRIDTRNVTVTLR
jgi:type VI secretion system protein VasD